LIASCISIAMLPMPAIGAQGASLIPDFSGTWGRNSLDFETAPSGHAPVTNIKRLPSGTSDQSARVGDFKNPILRPNAAEIVKRRGEISLSGTTFPDPSNQCWPYQPLYDFAFQFQTQILQQKDQITIIYDRNHEVRRVRMNQSHPARAIPSWMGDSVGHYEGDTLVVDTIGIKVGPYSMVDLYGTPFTEHLHVVERYRLIDGQTAKVVAERSERVNGHVRGSTDIVDLDLNHQEKGLQVQFMVEDEGVFTTSWSASVTYRRTKGKWEEVICAENPREFSGKTADLPKADKPDF